MSEADEVLAELEAVVTAWREERAAADWQETMRQCNKCKAWVNRHLSAEVMWVCPSFNLCEAGEVG